MSINERLGALCRRLEAEECGADLTPLTWDWLAEMSLFAAADAKDAEPPAPDGLDFLDDG